MSKRRILYLLLFPLVIVVSIAGLLSFSQSLLQYSIRMAMENFTNYRLVLDDPYFNIFTGTIHARTLQLYPESGGPALVSVSDVNGHTGLLDFYWRDLSYTSLYATNVQIYLAEQGTTESPDPIEWLQYLTWLPENLEVKQLHFVLAALETWVFVLEDISGERDLNTSYQLHAKSHYGDEPVTVNLDLLTIMQKKSLAGIMLAADIRSPTTGGWLELDGQLVGDEDSFSYDYKVNSHATNIERFMGLFKSGGNLDGTLSVAGTLVGNTEGISISDAHLLLDNLPDHRFEGDGIFHYNFSGESELDLTVSGEMRALEKLVDWIDIDLSTLGTAQARANITGSLDEPVIQNLILKTESDEGLQVKLSGDFAIDRHGTGVEYEAEEITVDLQAPSLAALGEWLGPLPYDPGPWRLTAALHRNGNGMEIVDINADAGKDDQLQLHIEGSIAKILDPGKLGIAGIEGIDLTMSVLTPALAELARPLGLNIPDLPTVRGQWTLTGSGEALSIDDGIFKTADDQFSAQLSGLQAQLYPARDMFLSSLSTRADITLVDSRVISRFVDLEVPALGAVALAGVVSQDKQKFRLDQLSAQIVNPSGLELTARGEIGNLVEMKSVSLHSQFSGLEIHKLLSSLLTDFQFGSSMGTLDGAFDLTNSDDRWQASNISVATDRNSIFHMSARGQQTDLFGTPSGTIETTFEIDSPDLLAELTGLRMDPVKGNAVIHNNAKDMSVVLEGSVGDTELSATARLGVTGDSISELELSINSPQVYLEDFDLQSTDSESGADYSPAEKIGENVSPSLLSRIVGSAPSYPVDVKIVLDNLNGESVDIDGIDIHLAGINGRHTLRKFTVNYGETAAEIRGLIDLNHTPPMLSIGGEIIDANMNQFMADLGLDSDVKGTLSMRAGLTTNGDNSEELVAALNGSFAMALEDAEVEGAAYDVLATDLLAWIYTGAATEESTLIDCTRAKFQLVNGQATSDDLYMETRRIIASGEGKLDLVNKRLDLKITPKSKSRIGQIPAAIRLSGKISDPEVSVSPLSAYANIYSEFLLIVPNFFMRVFGIQRSQPEVSCLSSLYL